MNRKPSSNRADARAAKTLLPVNSQRRRSARKFTVNDPPQGSPQERRLRLKQAVVMASREYLKRPCAVPGVPLCSPQVRNAAGGCNRGSDDAHTQVMGPDGGTSRSSIFLSVDPSWKAFEEDRSTSSMPNRQRVGALSCLVQPSGNMLSRIEEERGSATCC